jgi:hypothetical protein
MTLSKVVQTDTAVVDHISQAQVTVVVESCPFKCGTIKLPPDIAFFSGSFVITTSSTPRE